MASASLPELKYRLLLELAQRISRSLDLQDVLDHLLVSLRAAIPYDAAGVFVLRQSVPGADALKSHLIAGVARAGFGAPRADDPMLRLGEGIVGHVIRTGETVLAPDVRRDPRYVVGRPETRAELAAPIVSNAQVIGALNLESDRAGAFTAADAELLEFFASAAALSIEKSLLHGQVLEKQRMEQQLALAHEVQRGLLPAGPPSVSGYDVAAVQLPTWTIGGDYYDYIPVADGRLGLVIADVSGKGVPAALIMATFRAALRSELRRRSGKGPLMQELNRLLLEAQGESRFVTAVYGSLDPRSGRFGYVNCGHNPPLLLRADGRAEWLDSGGLALGMLPEVGFVSGTATLRPGDALVLYTDGVVEPTNGADEEFGVERLRQVLLRSRERSAAESVLAVVEATRTFTRRDRYDDDFTLVIVKRGTGDALRAAPGSH
ncbi:MAG: SpoIIE family protein phosphatase [Vicinamibacteria bacterium]|nr:SpoIIE family protein phosphatase [Vicinamibacteria bacterium]